MTTERGWAVLGKRKERYHLGRMGVEGCFYIFVSFSQDVKDNV